MVDSVVVDVVVVGQVDEQSKSAFSFRLSKKIKLFQFISYCSLIVPNI